MTPNELLLHQLTQLYYSTNDKDEQEDLLARMKKVSAQITEDKLPRTGWWVVNPNPGPGVGIPPNSLYIGTSLTLKPDRTVVKCRDTLTPSNHSAVIYWGTR